jgi:hypothetical protein
MAPTASPTHSPTPHSEICRAISQVSFNAVGALVTTRQSMCRGQVCNASFPEVTTVDECTQAATLLGLPDTFAEFANASTAPRGCYFKTSNFYDPTIGHHNTSLWFNHGGSPLTVDPVRLSVCGQLPIGPPAPNTAAPTGQPATATPTSVPTTVAPSARPTLPPTARPTDTPTRTPTAAPTARPSVPPTAAPSARPSFTPSGTPTTSQPTPRPTGQPTLSTSASAGDSNAAAASDMNIIIILVIVVVVLIVVVVGLVSYKKRAAADEEAARQTAFANPL